MAVNDFHDKVIVITGGTSGIGRQIALDLVQLGAKVVVTGRDQQRLSEIRELLKKQQPCSLVLSCDVAQPKQISGMATTVLQQLGHVDILINNAGYAVYRKFEESSLGELVNLLEVNLYGVICCTKAFLPTMIEQRNGHIVNISSIAGRMVFTPNAIYAAAKHGVVALTEALDCELQDYGIRFSVICPTRVATAFHDDASFRRKPNKRAISAEQVSHRVIEVLRRPRLMAYIPGYYKWIVWATSTFPFVAKPLYARLALARVRRGG
jgi:short-subunit dehydrogenase